MSELAVSTLLGVISNAIYDGVKNLALRIAKRRIEPKIFESREEYIDALLHLSKLLYEYKELLHKCEDLQSVLKMHAASINLAKSQISTREKIGVLHLSACMLSP